MAIVYTKDILRALKEKGYNTNYIRINNLLSEGCLQSLRTGRPIAFTTLNQLCKLLECQPGDLIKYVSD